MQRESLHEIADVISGYPFRGAIEESKQGNVRVFQAGDIEEGERFEDVKSLTLTELDIASHDALLQRGDIILLARGTKTGTFRSAMYDAEASNVIASSSVHVIRVVTDRVRPEYLLHYLNSVEGQRELSKIVSGSLVGAISRGRLAKEVSIPVPSLDKQKAFIALVHNIQAQRQNLKRQQELTQEILDGAFQQLA